MMTLTFNPTVPGVLTPGDDASLTTLQTLIGGYITTGVSCPFTDGGEVVVFCDDEGLLVADPVMTPIYIGTEFHNMLAGTLVFTACDAEGEQRAFTDREVTAVRGIVETPEMPHVLQVGSRTFHPRTIIRFPDATAL